MTLIPAKVVRLSGNEMIHLPRDVCRKLGLKIGVKLLLSIDEEGHLILEKLPPIPIPVKQEDASKSIES